MISSNHESVLTAPLPQYAQSKLTYSMLKMPIFSTASS